MFDKLAAAGKTGMFGKGDKMSMLKDKVRKAKPAVTPGAPVAPTAPTLPSQASDTARTNIMKGFLKRK